MTLRANNHFAAAPVTKRAGGRQRGSALIIVMWVAFGLVAVALYFSHSMTMEFRVADNRVAGLEAEQAVEGAARYVSNVLATTLQDGLRLPGAMPDPLTFSTAAVPVGAARFWLLGRAPSELQASLAEPAFGLVDEASKLNLNAPWLAVSNLMNLNSSMTAELAAAILDWRDTNSDVDINGGAEDETYLQLPTPYHCKNAPFESVEELRLVYGMNLALLYGEDANLNGVLDPNEDDQNQSPPMDNGNGKLDPGFLEYFTVYSREPATYSNGLARVNVGGITSQQLSNVLSRAGFDASRIQPFSTLGTNFGSVLQFYAAIANRNLLSPDEFALVEDAFRGTNLVGLVNVNTASEAVLGCVPGIGQDLAPTVVAFRQANPGRLNSVSWLAEALNFDAPTLARVGRYVTGRSWQYSADIVALGHFGRGYRRVNFVFDMSEGTPRVVRREELTHLGWALGSEVRRSLQLANQTP